MTITPHPHGPTEPSDFEKLSETGLCLPVEWRVERALRWNGDVLQQEWIELWSGKEEWRDVPRVSE